MISALEYAVERLSSLVRTLPSGAKSLSHVCAVVPTAQSGRRLRRALAEKFGAIVPPLVKTPYGLLLDEDDPALAGRTDEIRAFSEALNEKAKAKGEGEGEEKAKAKARGEGEEKAKARGEGEEKPPVNRTMIELLLVGRRFRLPGGSSVILGRDGGENVRLKGTRHSCRVETSMTLLTPPPGLVGPTALIPELKSEEDLKLAEGIVRAWCRGTTETDRAPYKRYQLT